MWIEGKLQADVNEDELWNSFLFSFVKLLPICREVLFWWKLIRLSSIVFLIFLTENYVWKLNIFVGF